MWDDLRLLMAAAGVYHLCKGDAPSKEKPAACLYVAMNVERTQIPR